ncbi:MAG: autophagy- protein 2 [Caeruleum heppii]|nr:MAG: autophagy- protein 2 [Caeruleum heppii]
MAFLLPSSLQKRLLRYALSRLELLDTDDLALDRLAVAWGKRSTVELTDVGLRLQKLASLLRLPAHFKLRSAKVILLRVTIPADIYSSAITVDIEGIDIRLSSEVEPEAGSRLPKLPSRSWQERSQPGTRQHDGHRISGQPGVYDPGGPSPRGQQPTSGADDDPILPTTEDLAASFLQAEPDERKAELEAVITAQSSALPQSTLSDAAGRDLGLGTGTSLALPTFLAEFLQGVGDRLQVNIKAVDIVLHTELSAASLADVESAVKSDPVTLRLGIAEIIVGEVISTGRGTPLDTGNARGPGKGTTPGDSDTTAAEPRRRIALKDINIVLVSETALFTSQSRSPAQSSPEATHANIAGSSKSASPGEKQPRPTRSLAPSAISSFSGRSNSHAKQTTSVSMPHATDEAHSDAREAENYAPVSEAMTNSGVADEGSDADYNPTEVETSDSISSREIGPHPHSSSIGEVPVDSDPAVDISTRSPQRPSSPESGRKFFRSKSSQTDRDNLRHATAALEDGMDNPEDMDDDDSPHEEDLSVSRIFSHEEAASMYMSALSTSSAEHSNRRAIPGQWNTLETDRDEDITPMRSNTPQLHGGITAQKISTQNEPPMVRPSSSTGEEDQAQSSANPQSIRKEGGSSTASARLTAEGDGDLPSLGQSTALPPSEPNESEPGSLETNLALGYQSLTAKQLLNIDRATLLLPSRSPSAEPSALSDVAPQHQDPMAMTSTYQEVPGAFSAYATRTSGFARSQELRSPPRTTQPPPIPSDQDRGQIEVSVGTVLSDLDAALIRVLAALAHQFFIRSNGEAAADRTGEIKASREQTGLQIRSSKVMLRFLGHIPGIRVTSTSSWSFADIKGLTQDTTLGDAIFHISLDDVAFAKHTQVSNSSTTCAIRKAVLAHAVDDIVSFDAGLQMQTSLRQSLSPTKDDIFISIHASNGSQKLNVSMLPMHISLDLQKLDETLGWFGGFSSILGLGSSIASSVTITGASAPPHHPPRPRRGVHFTTSPSPPPPPDQQAAEAKADARIGGVVIDLIGRACSLHLDSSAVKIVKREEGIGAQVDRIRLSGPHVRGKSHASSLLAQIDSTRVEYLSMPQEVDLGRLLGLLTPSRNKYDEDDDILLDTLLRQRRQGSVVRLTLSKVNFEMTSHEDLEYLATLGQDMAKLSTVAKYLPEDDRPGIMSLLLIRDLHARCHIRDGIGSLLLESQTLEAAHVNLPSLLALRLETIRLSTSDNETLLGAAATPVTSNAEGQTPMAMARMIGDEMEPTIKLKLYNVALEYRVSFVMALLASEDKQSTDGVAADLTASIATSTSCPRRLAGPSSSAFSLDKLGQKGKPVKIDIALRDCCIGLNPLSSPSKALLVLTKTRLRGRLPSQERSQATLEISKASLLLVDDVVNLENEPVESAATRHAAEDAAPTQLSHLCDIGFVPVSYMSSARAVIHVAETRPSGERCVDLELKDDLLVVETCADSTQTLLAVLNGLKPPAAPNEDVRYRTEIVPVQDMLASLSGEAFEPAKQKYTNEEVLVEAPEGDDFDDDADLDPDLMTDFYHEGSDSLREDENFGGLDESTNTSLKTSTADLREGEASAIPDGRLDDETSTSHEALDFVEDHFTSRATPEDMAPRWDSVKNAYGSANEQKRHVHPLKVRIRDVHFIWNLFDGYDWHRTRETISRAVKEVETKAIERRARRHRRSSLDADEDDESVIGDFLFNSIYIGIPANKDPRELQHQINRNVDDMASETGSYATSTVSESPGRQSRPHRGGRKKLRLTRSKHHKMTFELQGICMDLVVFPAGSGETQSSLDVRIRDLDIFDHVPTSTWKKFATYMHDAGERESGSNMIHLEFLTVKPIPELAASELVLKATLLPLRLHVDQDALDFLTRFFEFKDESMPVHATKADVPFLQRVEVRSVRLKLDYKPKSVDYAGIRSGHTTEFMNFFILDQADMVLRHVIIYGVSGFDRLSRTLNDIWMPDIKKTQLPGVLAGLAPVRSIVNVGGGVRDLVVVPMREYRKDGRVVRSLQKGALTFAKTTTSELVKLGAKLAIGTQTVLQGAERFLSKPGQEGELEWSDEDVEEAPKAISLYAEQPVGVVQGLRGAYASLERDLLTTRDAIVAMPGEMLESGSAQGAAKAVLKRAPTVIFRPAIGASKAISQTLMGATSALDPQHRRRMDDKYKKY